MLQGFWSLLIYKATQEMSVYLGCADCDKFSWAMEFHVPY